jgi:hypothetical protein
MGRLKHLLGPDLGYEVQVVKFRSAATGLLLQNSAVLLSPTCQSSAVRLETRSRQQ